MKFLKSYTKTDFSYVLLFLVLSLGYFSLALQNILLPVFILSVLFNYKEANFKDNSKIILFVISVPFILTIISCFYSENIDVALKLTTRRALLIIIGFFVLAMPHKALSFIKGVNLFIFFSIIASLITITRGILLFNHNGVFFHPNFTPYFTVIHHPYFAAYLLIALILMMEYFNEIKFGKWVKVFSLTLLAITIILSTARLGQVSLFLYFSYKCFGYLKGGIKTKKVVSLSVLIVFLFSLLFITRTDIIAFKYNQDINLEKSPRLIIWNNTIKVIKNQTGIFKGIGIGDYQKILDEQYSVSMHKDYSKMILIDYNPHNQYLEFLLTNGGLGVVFSLYVLYFLLKAFNLKNKVFFIYMIFISFFFLTECVLNRQIGIYFVAVLLPVLYKISFLNKVYE